VAFSTYQATGVAAAPVVTTPSGRALLATGLAAGLLPFASPTATDRLALLPSSVSSALAVAAGVAISAGTVSAGRAGRPAAPSGGGGGGGAPDPPSHPPGNAGAGGIATGPGGGVSGVWCAILLCFLLLAATQLRSHEVRFLAPTSSGVVVLLQRPG
jgi:hypothetical protein